MKPTTLAEFEVVDRARFPEADFFFYESGGRFWAEIDHPKDETFRINFGLIWYVSVGDVCSGLRSGGTLNDAAESLAYVLSATVRPALAVGLDVTT